MDATGDWRRGVEKLEEFGFVRQKGKLCQRQSRLMNLITNKKSNIFSAFYKLWLSSFTSVHLNYHLKKKLMF